MKGAGHGHAHPRAGAARRADHRRSRACRASTSSAGRACSAPATWRPSWRRAWPSACFRRPSPRRRWSRPSPQQGAEPSGASGRRVRRHREERPRPLGRGDPRRQNQAGLTPMFDTTIRGGTLVDGSGQPRFTGDIGIVGDRIAAVGGKLSPGVRDIEAERRDRHAGLGRRAHALRRPGHLGPLPEPQHRPRRDQRRDGQLRRRLRAGAGGSARLADQRDGGCRGHPRHRAGRGHPVAMGELSRVPGCARQDAAGAGRRRADPAFGAAHLRDGRTRHHARRGRRRPTSRRWWRWCAKGCAPARWASRPAAPSSTSTRAASTRREPLRHPTRSSGWRTRWARSATACSR
jgi:hypothetical protein